VITVEGKGGIKASVVADSISEAGGRITTFELEYPRFIHSEFMTHRQFSRNAASSRAIPVEKVIEQVEKSYAMPIHWGKNQPGMQAKAEVGSPELAAVEWMDAAHGAVDNAEVLLSRGLHKQIVNRILEPYQFIKVVCTATEYENFFYLRDHADAQPEIAELARCMREARDQSEPQLLKAGEWHLPYVSTERDCDGELRYTTEDIDFECVDNAIKLSASLCAQVSYRKSDESIEKALKIYHQLVNMKPVHASPFEHQATPMETPITNEGWYLGEGVTHCDVSGNLWSGNFKGFIQHRQLIEGHVYAE
jgi:thymidylate synthase ThyX